MGLLFYTINKKTSTKLALDTRSLIPVSVIPPGLEPGTYSLEGCCSIQLSYGTIYNFGGQKYKNF